MSTDEDNKKPIYKQGWLWGAVAGVTIAIAVGVGAYVYFRNKKETGDDPSLVGMPVRYDFNAVSRVRTPSFQVDPKDSVTLGGTLSSGDVTKDNYVPAWNTIRNWTKKQDYFKPRLEGKSVELLGSPPSLLPEVPKNFKARQLSFSLGNLESPLSVEDFDISQWRKELMASSSV